MQKEIQYSRISTKLQNLKAAHPQDVNAKLWKETFKGLINGGEAMRLFDVFAGTLMLLEARNKTYLKWSDKANAANWTAKWLENLFNKYDILSKYGPTVDATGKALHPKRRKEAPVAMAVVIEEAPVDVPDWQNVPAPEGPLEAVAFTDLTSLTDGQLNMIKWHIAAEEKRREEERKKAEEEAKKQAKLKAILETFKEMAASEGVSWEDIINTDKIVWVNKQKRS